MPYCPNCDMEFIEGITICSDCQSPLTASKEKVRQLKSKEESAGLEAVQAMAARPVVEEEELSPTIRTGNRVYVKKAQQYEDLKSSASAFYLVGGILLAAALLSWTGILNLPMAAGSPMITKMIITLMGISAILVGAASGRSAKSVESQVGEEEMATQALIEWFLNNHDAETIDYQLTQEGDFAELSPEEQSLKRFDLIQDIFIISYDLQDQGYVDLLAEEIYVRLFE